MALLLAQLLNHRWDLQGVHSSVNYQIMPPNWSCRLGRQTLAGEAIDSQQTASLEREGGVIYAVVLFPCLYKLRPSRHRHPAAPWHQMLLHSWMCYSALCTGRHTRWWTLDEENPVRKHRRDQACPVNAPAYRGMRFPPPPLPDSSSAKGWISLAKMLRLKHLLPLFID